MKKTVHILTLMLMLLLVTSIQAQQVQAPTGSTTQTFCDGATIADLVATGNNIQWYDAAGGNLLDVSTVLVDATVYYATQTIGGVESSGTLAVTTKINTANYYNPSTIHVTGFTGGFAHANGDYEPVDNYDYDNPMFVNPAGNRIWWEQNESGYGTWKISTTNNDGYFMRNITGKSYYFPTTGWTSRLNVTPTFTGYVGFIAPHAIVKINGVANWYERPSHYSYQLTSTSNIEPGTPVVLIANAEKPGSAVIAYQWQINNVDVSGETTGVFYSTTLSDGDVVTCVLTSTETCASPLTASSNTISFTWMDAPTGEAAQTFNSGATLADLVAIGQNIKWYDASYTWANLLDMSTPLVNGATYYATQTINGVESSAKLTVTVSQNAVITPPPTGTATQTLNPGSTIANLVATGTDLKWYDAATGGNLLDTTTVLVDGSIYYGTQTIDGIESIETFAVTINIGTQVPTGTASQTFCSGATVANLVATGTNLKWYDAATGGNLLDTSTLLVNGTIYYATQTIESLESIATFAVTTTVNSGMVYTPSTVYATGFEWYSTVNGALAPSGTINNAPSWMNGEQDKIVWNGKYWEIMDYSGVVYATNSTGSALYLPADHWYSSYLTPSLSGGVGKLAAGVPVKIIASATTIIPGNSVTFTATPLNYANETLAYQWQLNGVNIDGATDVTYTSTDLVNNDVVTCVLASIESSTCSVPVLLTSNPITMISAVAAPVGEATQTFCSGTTIANLVATGDGIKWYDAATSGNILNASTVLVNGGVYYATQTVNSIESITTLAVTVTVNPSPNAGTITGTANLCINSTSKLTSNGMAGGTWESDNTSVATVASDGTVNGKSAGTANITYSVTSASCGSAKTSNYMVTVNALPNAGTISTNYGNNPNIITNTFCATYFLDCSTTGSGGTWSSDNTNLVIVKTSTNPVSVTTPSTISGDGSGNGTAYTMPISTANIVYTVTSTYCGTSTAIFPVTVLPFSDRGTISGNSAVCTNATTTFTNNSKTTPFGVKGPITYRGLWSSLNTSVATVDANTGVVTGKSGGTASIKYGASGCGAFSITKTITVNALANAGTISGVSTLCAYSTTKLSSTGTIGGTWASDNTNVATVASDGTVSGVSAGTSNITYSVTSGSCGSATSSNYQVTVNPFPNAGSINGINTLCANGTTKLSSNGNSGGTWSSDNLNIATVASDGTVSGVSAGTAKITYTITTANCGIDYTYTYVTVNALPNAGTIIGANSVRVNGTTKLTSTGDVGGTWAINSTSIATVASDGTVSGVNVGTANLTYAVSTANCGTAITSLSINVFGISPTIITRDITATYNDGANYSAVPTTNSTGAITYKSSNKSVALVDSTSGAITVIGVGTATITVSEAADANYLAGNATVNVTVFCNRTTSTINVSACDNYTWNGTPYTRSGTYTYTIKNAAGCDSVATLNLTIKQPSTSTTTVSNCGTYHWNGQDYTKSGTYTYTLKNAADCDSIATLNLSITEPVVPSISITSTQSGTLCAGSSVTLTATSSNAGSKPSYQWYNGSVGISGKTTNIYIYTPTVGNKDSISIRLTNANNVCQTASTAISNIITPIITAKLSPSVSIVSLQTKALCTDSTITFTSRPLNGGVPTYQWYKGKVLIKDAIDSNYSYVPAFGNKDSINVKIVSTYFCPLTSTATSNFISPVVTVNVTPSVAITSSQTGIVCSGSLVTFTAKAVNSGIPTYQWYNGTNAISGATGLSYRYNPTVGNTDTIHVEVVTNNVCQTANKVISNNIKPEITPLSNPTVSIVASKTGILCTNTSLKFTTTASSDALSPTYQWYKGNSLIPGATDSIYSYVPPKGNLDLIKVKMTTIANICSTPTFSNVIRPTVIDSVTPSVTIKSSQTGLVCYGTFVYYTPTLTNCGTSPTYQWYNGKTAISSATSLGYRSIPTVGNNDSIHLVVFTNGTCQTASTAISNNITPVITPVSKPTVSIVASKTGVLCTNTNLSFSATASSDALSPTYQWYSGNTLISGATDSIYTYVPPIGNPDLIKVKLTTTANICSTPTFSNAIHPIVIDSVTPSVTIISSQTGLVCSGSLVTFTAKVINSGIPTYQWYNGTNAISGAIGSAYRYNPSVGNTDTIQLKVVTNNICQTASTAISNRLVSIITPVSKPTVSIVASKTGILCTNTTLNFSATASSEALSPTYQWYNGNSLIPGATDSIYSYVPSKGNPDLIKVKMTTIANICSTPTFSNAIHPTVIDSVTPSVTIKSSQTGLVCYGTFVYYTPTLTNCGTSPTYQWYNGKTAISSATSLGYRSIPTVGNNDSIHLVVFTNGTCQTASTAISNNITPVITPNYTPIVSIVSSQGTAKLCNGANVIFTATGSSGAINPRYQWYKSSVPINGETGSTYNYTPQPNNNDLINVQLTTDNLCPTSSYGISNKISPSIIANVTPSVTINSLQTSPICEGSSAGFTAIPTNCGITNYQWYNGKNAISGAVNSTYTYVPKIGNTDSIKVVAGATNTCQTANSASSNSIMPVITVIASAATTVTANPSTTVVKGASVIFTATPNTTFRGKTATYQWYVNGRAIPEFNSSFTYAPNNNDAIRVYCFLPGADNYCMASNIAWAYSNTVTMKVTASTNLIAVNENRLIQEQSGIQTSGIQASIYPNPSHGSATLKLQGITSNVSIKVVGIYGNTVASYKTERDEELKLPSSSLASGVYIVTISSNNQSKSFKWFNNR